MLIKKAIRVILILFILTNEAIGNTPNFPKNDFNNQLSQCWAKHLILTNSKNIRDEFPEIFKNLDTIIFMSRAMKDEMSLGKAFLEKGVLLYNTYKNVDYYIDSAIFYLDKNSEEYLTAEYYKIDLLIAAGDFDKAKEICYKNTTNVTSGNQKLYKCRFNSKLSDLLNKEGKWKDAVKNEELNLKYAKFSNNLDDITNCYITLSKLNNRYDCNKSIEYFDEAYKYVESSNISPLTKSKIYSCKAQQCNSCYKSVDSCSILAYEKAIEIIKNTRHVNYEFSLKISLANIYVLRNDLAKAKTQYYFFLDYLNNNYITDSVGIANFYYLLTGFFTKENKKDSAIYFGEKAFKINYSRNNSRYIYFGSLSLMDLFINSDSPEKALYYYKISDSVGRILQYPPNYENIRLISSFFETKKKNEIIKQIEHEKEIANKNFYFALLAGLALIIIIVSSGFIFYRFKQNKLNQKLLQEENEKVKTKNEVLELQQRFLTSQMNPHFIFNSLNSVRTFIAENEKVIADQYICDFAKLMRLILDASRKKIITLEDEISIIKYYLQLEQIRASNSFDFNFFIDEEIDEDKDELKILPMLLQPFIENAIIHGISNIEKRGKIDIHINSYEKEFIKIEIIDNGRGRKKAHELKKIRVNKHESHAMKIMEERINTFNKENEQPITLNIIDSENGTHVVLIMPMIY